MKISSDLVLYNDSSATQQELFQKVESILFEKNIVKEGFGSALLKRESKYPTGIGMNGFNVALSHTSPEYSNTNEVMLVKLENPINFISMETGEAIPVKYVFILVLKDGGNHLTILQKLAGIMQDNKWVEKIEKANSKSHLLEVINEAFE